MTEYTITVPKLGELGSFDKSTYRMTHIARQIVAEDGGDPNDAAAVAKVTGFGLRDTQGAIARLNDLGYTIGE